MKGPKKLPAHCGFGVLQTSGHVYHKTCSKNVKKRIKRWAKHVLNREATDVERKDSE